jgi:phosphatidylglycerol lysyltransferase
MRERLYRALPAVAGLALFVAALEVLRRELRTLTWHTLKMDVFSTPSRQLLAALFFVALNYAVLTGYDFIALASIGKKFPARRVFLTSFLAYAVANNVGFAMLSGASVRYRFYSRLGISVQDLSRIVISCSLTFWLGLFTLGGLSLVLSPPEALAGLPTAAILLPLGFVLVLSAPAYLLLTVLRRVPIRLRGLELPLPNLKLAVAQLLISTADWMLAAAVLFVVLPAGSVPFAKVLEAFLLAQLLGLASHIPGGVGVFEGLIVLLLQPFLSPDSLLTALVVFRVLYYLLPLSVAIVILMIDAIRQHGTRAKQVTAYIGSLSKQFTPQALAVITFIGGVVLLFSGATPAAEGRLAFLNRFLPIGVLETSHFLGSLAGIALLLLSQGLARRLDAAYWLAVFGVSLGIVTSLLKSGGYEEAVFLAVLLALLGGTSSAFDRNAAFFETSFSVPWIVAIAAALASSIWLGLFSYKHVEFSRDLWWQFALHGEVSRFLRASVGVAITLLVFAAARLLGFAPHEAPEPTTEDLDTAAAIIVRQKETYPNLVFLRDKAVLFDEKRSGFVMYGVQGRTWVALGDPVCPEERIPDFVRLFLERCDDFGATPVFYEVRPEHLHHYADFGLSVIKLGEEAIVDLNAFSLEGSQASRLRQAIRRLDKEGLSYRVLSRDEAIPRMGEFRNVSDEWLRGKTGGEKGFSLGLFDADYLSRFSIAVIEREGHILAFANLWQASGKEQFSADLMRYSSDAPKGIMEPLFVRLILWGKEQGFARFSLGMAPMSGFEQSPIAPLWTKFGTFLYEHGEAIYKFQGLRAFKEKFDPIWESRYMASPGGLKLPRILADVVALVAGGYRRVLLK